MNPIEVIFSIFNIGLQHTTVQTEKLEDKHEKIMRRNLNDIRDEITTNHEFKDALQKSIVPVVEGLNDCFERLSLKDKKFTSLPDPTPSQYTSMQNVLNKIDNTCKTTDTIN